MKAVGIKNGKGNADAFFIEDNVPDPVATAGRILVSIKAFGLNRMDIMQREDKYPYPLLPESGKILGVEFSGLVEEVGPDCKCKLCGSGWGMKRLLMIPSRCFRLQSWR